MADDDVTVVPTRPQTGRSRRQSVEATYHETRDLHRQRPAQRAVAPSEESSDDHTDSTAIRYGLSQTTLGLIAFLIGAAALLYGVALGLDAVRQTLEQTVLGALLDSSALVATVETTQTVAGTLFGFGGLGVAAVAGRAALSALGRS